MINSNEIQKPRSEKVYMVDVPLVSAIITTHNRKDLVIKAINSVKRQTYQNLEIIVVDDASEDEVRELLTKKAQKEEFTYIYIPEEESKGGNHARNVGIQNSKGKYIAFLDDDDEWMPEKIEKQVSFLEKNLDYGVVSCLRRFEYDTGEIKDQEDVNLIEGDLRQSIFTNLTFVSSTLMINKQILVSIGLFDENLKYWQDFELNIRYAQITKVGIIHEHLCLYRIRIHDKKRLTNNLAGWQDAVQYICTKHKDLITHLPKDYYKKLQVNIATDGIDRAKKSMNEKEAAKYYRLLMMNNPSIKNMMLVILGLRGNIAVKKAKEYFLKL